MPSPDDRQNLPDTNVVAFKGQGRLALVWRGMLYVLDGDTGEVRQLTSSGQASQPAWSHDGEWLAFVRTGDPQAATGAPAGEGTVWLIGAGGGAPKKICGLSDREDDGADFGYYGYVSYLDEFAWFQP